MNKTLEMLSVPLPISIIWFAIEQTSSSKIIMLALLALEVVTYLALKFGENNR